MAALGIDRRDFDAALYDIRAGLGAWRLWSAFALSDVKYKYRRSTLGPFWTVISMAITIFTTAFVLSFIYNTPLEKFLPFICISLILWNHLIQMVNEGAQVFIAAAELILQVKRPLSIYIWQTVFRTLILASHTMVVFFVVAIIFGVWPGWTYILEIPGLFLFVINATWISAVCAILSTRFRDLPLIVSNLFTVFFWLAPVLYQPDQVRAEMKFINNINPLTHILNVARMPLLLETPSVENWIVSIATAVVGWAILILLFARSRKRIAYWL